MPAPWQQFSVSIIFIVLVPLAVLLLDVFIKHQIPDGDLFLTFAIYLVATGASSRSIAILAASIALGAAYFIAYGVAAAAPEACPPPETSHTTAGYFFRYGSPVIFTAICAAERYNRHVVETEKFWDFK
jgi:hypothetical protein